MSCYFWILIFNLTIVRGHFIFWRSTTLMLHCFKAVCMHKGKFPINLNRFCLFFFAQCMSPCSCSNLVFVHCPHTAAGGGLLLGTEDEDRSWAVRTAGMCPRLSPTPYTERCNYSTWPVDGSKPRQVSLSLILRKTCVVLRCVFVPLQNIFFWGEELQKLCQSVQCRIPNIYSK